MTTGSTTAVAQKMDGAVTTAPPSSPKPSEAVAPAKPANIAPAPAAAESSGAELGSIVPPERPSLSALVLSKGDLRNQEEAEILRTLKTEPPLAVFPTGYPSIVERKHLPLVDDDDRRLFVLGGFCPGDRAEAMAAALGARAQAVRRGAVACPTLTAATVPKALERAIESGQTAFALELVGTPLSEEVRGEALRVAAIRCDSKLVEKLLPAISPSVDGLTAQALDCSPVGDPHLLEDAAVPLVELLLGRGAKAKLHPEWLVAALRSVTAACWGRSQVEISKIYGCSCGPAPPSTVDCRAPA